VIAALKKEEPAPLLPKKRTKEEAESGIIKKDIKKQGVLSPKGNNEAVEKKANDKNA
jgi:hypothetical protein